MLLSPKPGVVYGPVNSRRLGRSLGINLLPPREKPCTLDCVYCQYGFTQRAPAERDAFPDVQTVLAAIDEALAAQAEAPDFLTFSGNGEPTTHPRFHDAVDGVLALRDRLVPRAKVAVLSNSTELHQPTVRQALARVDLPILKLDAGTQALFDRYSRPLRPIALWDLVAGMRDIPNPTLQSLFTAGPGGNSAPADVDAWLVQVAAIRPADIQIHTLDRDWPMRDIHPLPRDELEAIAAKVRAIGVRATVFGPRPSPRGD